MNVVPHPPSAVVPLPPPPAAVVPTRSGASGVAMDMSSLFVGGTTGKRAIPPWERRSKTPTQPSKVLSGMAASPPVPAPATALPASASEATNARASGRLEAALPTTALPPSSPSPPLAAKASATETTIVSSPPTVIAAPPPPSIAVTLQTKADVNSQTTAPSSVTLPTATTVLQTALGAQKPPPDTLPPRSVVVIVPPLSRVHRDVRPAPPPARKGGAHDNCARGDDVPVSPTYLWHNQYDLRPSPSAALHHTLPTALTAAAQAAQERDAASRHKAMNVDWRGAHWRHVDVHRYIARRYLGEPPVLER